MHYRRREIERYKREIERSKMSLNEGQLLIGFGLLLAAASFPRHCLSASDWSYDDHHGNSGPSNWKKRYPECGMSEQSPIDIRTSVSKYRHMEELVFYGYENIPTKRSYTLTNNGHSVQLSVVKGDMGLTKGELHGVYKLVQFHVHWGSTNSGGSEHTVNGRSHPMEIHFVHYNTDRYRSIADAMTQTDGLAVLGVFADVGEKSHPVIEKLIESFCAVKYAGSNTTDVSEFRMVDLLPSNRESFYRYSGSLTTPGCHESVLWTILKEPIKISQTQLNAFRALGHYVRGYKKDAPMVDNFRPVQPLGSRILLRNHELHADDHHHHRDNHKHTKVFSNSADTLISAKFSVSLMALVAVTLA